jgi:probable HAF family extracellular repeat protein
LLGSLGGGYSEALGIASGPRVVGVASDGSGTLRAFLFEQGAMTDLQSRVLTSTAPFLGLARAVGIDEAGRIAVEVRVAAPGGEATRLGLLRPRP